MQNPIHNTLRLTACALSASLCMFGAAQAMTMNMSKTDYSAGKTRISTDYKADKVACDSLSANAKDICVQEAKGKEKVARAELEYSYTGKASDGTKVAMAKADSAYAIAKERCDDKAGNDKDVCVKEAKASHTKAVADAKASKQIGEARSDAAADTRDADYKVATQKCEALAGDPKAACMAAAKSKYGKS